MTVLLIFVVLNCSMARYNGRLHCIVGVLPTCYKRKAATYFYPPGGTGPLINVEVLKKIIIIKEFSKTELLRSKLTEDIELRNLINTKTIPKMSLTIKHATH